ncbi:DUF1302 domain-containing protein [Duganella radicis]|uniref:DUF1302 family protein n=1 Tax=Duganella radicis TaxID=551988 RepID=A0A6L6PBR8_9BURK|nr:DUF1302 domain-containing protein [Duganella radicis]MTV36021.1 DUF1302 family protein [Duganella radicis]
MISKLTQAAFAVSIAYAGAAQAATFQTDSISGSFDSTVTAGIGVRAQNPSCSLITAGASGSGAPAGCLAPTSALGDQGDLNYGRGDPFTAYLKGTHELLLKMPDDWKFLGRVSWVRDFASTHTNDYISATNPPGIGPLTSDAADDLRLKARLLDFWVSKEFSLGEERARVRVGNQVISWGESLFLPGGINQTNAMDIMRLSQPGTQLKEVFLPAPIVSFATGLGHGFNFEAYVQGRWNDNYFPPTGSYWSNVNGLGKGDNAYGLPKDKARNGGQYGASLRWQPEGTSLNLGLYAMRYQDKAPQFSLAGGAPHWTFAEDRKMVGISANLPVGDWALGTELSYRPKDAVALNSAASGCSYNNGNCYVNEKKLQWHGTAMLSLTPSEYGGILKALGGADTATLLAEAVVVRYPNLKRFYGADPVSAGGWGWGQEFNPAGTPESVGSKTSWGYNFDFSWVYDGTLVSGWQVVPELYYFQAVNGRTPNTAGLFMKGAKSANFTVTFMRNPATWQFAVNYGRFWGGDRVYDQPLRDRGFVGAYVSRNF